MKPALFCLPLAILLATVGLRSQSAHQEHAPAAQEPAAQAPTPAPAKAPAGAQAGTKSGAAPAAAVARDEAAIARGQRTYTKVGCYQCHGREGQGSSASGPRIGPAPPPLAAFLAYVRAPAGEMPPYTAKVISDADLTDIHAFLAARAPAVAPADRRQ